MSEYPGQELSIEQLFHAVNAKILERTSLYRSSVPEPDQERWVSIPVTSSGGLTTTAPACFLDK